MKLLYYAAAALAPALVVEPFSTNHTICAVLGCVALAFTLPNTRKRRRRLSFSGEVMATGLFSDKVACIEPIINVELRFDGLPDKAELCDKVKMLLQYDRFSSIPTNASGEWVYEPVKTDPLSHIIYADQVNGEDELRATVDKIISKDLSSRDKPFWEMVVIPVKGGDDAIIFRIHHIIGDGIALVRVWYDMLTDAKGKQLTQSKVFSRKNKNFEPSLSILGKVLVSIKDVLLLPFSAYDTPTAFLEKDRKTHTYSGTRKTVVVPKMRLDFIKALKNKAGVTVNDVMMSACAGALRRYCEQRGDPAMQPGKKVQCRALLPVAFPRRPPKNDAEKYGNSLHNRFAFVSAALAVDGADIKQRMRQTKATTAKLKNSPTALVQQGIQDHVASMLPKFQQQQTALDTFARHSMVFSNVPGPAHPVFLCGKEIKGAQMLFPNLICQVGILSYNGTVCMNFQLDPQVVQDSHLLAKAFIDELEAMAQEYGVDGQVTVDKN